MVEITFDPAKRKRVLEERGLDFALAGQVFSGRTATIEDTRKAYPEHRFITAGLLEARIVVIVWTPTAIGRRIISMRYCHDDEARRWREQMG